MAEIPLGGGSEVDCLEQLKVAEAKAAAEAKAKAAEEAKAKAKEK